MDSVEGLDAARPVLARSYPIEDSTIIIFYL